MSLIRKHGAVWQAWACLALFDLGAYTAQTDGRARLPVGHIGMAT